MFYQIFVSPQVKRSVIIINTWYIRINSQEKLGKSQNLLGF